MRFKKLGALILGALLTIGVAAGIGATVEKDRVKAAGAETKSVELIITGTTGVLASDNSSISWTDGGVTFTNKKGSTAIRTSDSDHYRIYANSSIEINCANGNITKFEVTCTSSGNYANVWKNSIGDGAEVNGSIVNVTLTNPMQTYNIANVTAQTRVNKIVISYVSSGGSSEESGNSYKIKATEKIDLAPTMSQTIKSAVYNTEDAIVESVKVAYESLDTSIATVDNNGLVTAVGVGTTTVVISADNADSFEVEINVSYEYESSISISSSDNSDGYNALNNYLLTKDENIGVFENDFININITTVTNIGNASNFTIRNGAAFSIAAKDDVLINSISFILEQGVTDFKNSIWTNASPNENSLDQNAILIIDTPTKVVEFESIDSDGDVSFQIQTIIVDFTYKQQITNFSSVAFDFTNVKTKYEIFDKFTLEGLKVTVTDDQTQLNYDYYYGDVNMNVDSTISHGTKLTATNITVINLGVTFIGDVKSTLFESSYNIEISSTLTLTVASTTPQFVKVTSAPTDWSGEYLIVYEEGKVAFNGGLTELDATENTISVAITDDAITADETTKAAKFTINSDGHIISESNYYIGQTSDANGLKSSETTTYANTFSLNNDGTVNVVSGGAYLRYNAASNQCRFRYFKSATYSGQKAINLYKLISDTEITATDGITTFISTVKDDNNPLLSCDMAGSNSLINWTEIGDLFDELSNDDKTILQTAVAVSEENGGNIIEDFLSDYDYLVSTYSQYANNNFIGRPKTEGTSTMSPFNTMGQETSTIIALVAIVALSGFAFFYVAKRKNKEFEF